MGDNKNIILKEKLGLITSYRDKFLAPLLNTQMYNKGLHEMHVEKFDENIKPSGWTKEQAAKEGIKINYTSMDKYRNRTQKNNMNLFKNGDTFKQTLNKMNSYKNNSELKHKIQRKQIDNLKDISENLYKEFLKNPNADVSKYEKRLFTEAGIGNFNQIHKYINNIKKQAQDYKDKNLNKEKEKA